MQKDEANYNIRRLQKEEKVESFNCGDADLNDFILAVPFYIKNGFIPLTTDDGDSATRLLYFDLANIADDFEV